MSEKYILACDATTLFIRPEYYDFFVRGMIPLRHYWPVRPDNMCPDIKFAVDWGNNHTFEVSIPDLILCICSFGSNIYLQVPAEYYLYHCPNFSIDHLTEPKRRVKLVQLHPRFLWLGSDCIVFQDSSRN